MGFSSILLPVPPVFPINSSRDFSPKIGKPLFLGIGRGRDALTGTGGMFPLKLFGVQGYCSVLDSIAGDSPTATVIAYARVYLYYNVQFSSEAGDSFALCLFFF